MLEWHIMLALLISEADFCALENSNRIHLAYYFHLSGGLAFLLPYHINTNSPVTKQRAASIVLLMLYFHFSVIAFQNLPNSVDSCLVQIKRDTLFVKYSSHYLNRLNGNLFTFICGKSWNGEFIQVKNKVFLMFQFAIK